MRTLKMICCAAALVAFIAPAAHADEWNKLTFFTFSGPVQIPNATLPAGTYTFKLADMYGDRHIVEIYNKDQTKLITTLMAIPSDRGEDNEADKPIVMFSETPAGQPAAVKAWFYPGARIGDEFVYPKNQAMKIAKAYHKPVVATDTDIAKTKAGDKSTWERAKVGHMDENGQMTGDDRTTASNAAPAATGTTAQNGPAQVGTTARNNAADQNNNTGRRARHLPKTASPLGLFALLSGVSLAGGLGVRRVRARLANNAWGR